MNESVNVGRQNEDDESIETDTYSHTYITLTHSFSIATCCMCSGSIKMMCLKVLEQSRFTIDESEDCVEETVSDSNRQQRFFVSFVYINILY